MIASRSVQENDWKRIEWLASNSVQEADHSKVDTEWVRKRKDFSGERFQSVLENDGQVVGYCGLEKDESNEGFRGFLVADWSHGITDFHESLFCALEKLVSVANTQKVWMRELTGDKTLIKFVESKGFSIEKFYEFDGLRLVNLIKEYDIQCE